MHPLTIDLLRHGETRLHGSLLGHTDSALSDNGWQQLTCFIQGESLPWQKIISSPLQRCMSFADQLSKQHDIPLSIESDFQEMDFGDWDGQQLKDLYEGSQAADLMTFFNNPDTATPPNGETFIEFETRVLHGWNKLSQALLSEQVHHVVLITHGGVIRVILKQLLGLTTDKLSQITINYAGLSRIQCFGDYPDRLVFLNQEIKDARQLSI